jgi:hypothetical protein
MAPALALRHDHAPTPTEALPTRDEALARYRHLRQISRGHNSAMMELLSIGAILQQARRLGLADGRAFVLDRMDDMSYVWDLVIHTAPPGRSRAIDRYARSARLAPGSDEAIVLDAMCKARFAVIAVKDRHPVAGLIVTDLFRGAELWIVDEGLEMSLAPGATIATRYFAPDRFAMAAGVIMPFNRDLLADVVASVPQVARRPPVEAIDDRRLAEAIYREGIAAGLNENAALRDGGDEDDQL